MTKPSFTQSQKRFQESIGALFSQNEKNTKHCLVLKSSTDIGVIRNGGRNGARFAPQSFLSTFKKFSQNESLQKWTFEEREVSSKDLEEENFQRAQEVEAQNIAATIAGSSAQFVCHLGGGHDHIYPLLKAVSPGLKKVVVINIDAHADTRTDGEFHSGTPFRQFSEAFSGEFKLYQIGLHPFANSFSTLSPLSKGQMNILWKKDLNEENLKRFFAQIKSEVNKETLVVFSLDADALHGTEVPGVSAVNPEGLSRGELLLVWNEYISLPLSHSPYLGIYELNPLYDTLASLSMRTLGSFFFEALIER